MKLIYFSEDKNEMIKNLKNKIIEKKELRYIKGSKDMKLCLKHKGEFKRDYPYNYYFLLDSKLLLENKFTLNLDYSENKYENGRTLREYELKEKLKKYYDNTIKYMEKRLKSEPISAILNLYTDFIEAKENISLEKYLKSVHIPKYDKKIVDYCKKYYPDVIIKISKK